MNLNLLAQKLNENKTVYIKDDYEEKAIKIMPNETVFIKPKGGTEYHIDPTSRLVFDIEQNGNEITKEEYENY